MPILCIIFCLLFVLIKFRFLAAISFSIITHTHDQLIYGQYCNHTHVFPSWPSFLLVVCANSFLFVLLIVCLSCHLPVFYMIFNLFGMVKLVLMLCIILQNFENIPSGLLAPTRQSLRMRDSSSFLATQSMPSGYGSTVSLHATMPVSEVL